MSSSIKKKPLRKFLCIRGPFDGEWKTWIEISYTASYHQYNSSGTAPLSAIFVWLPDKVSEET
jgi:hypothetical protein